MVRTTKAQRKALWSLFCRNGPTEYLRNYHTNETYRQFRKRVQPTFGMDGCIVIHWCGMWLGIEPDGYTHS